MSGRILLVSAVATGGVAGHIGQIIDILVGAGTQVTFAAPDSTLASVRHSEHVEDVSLPVAARPSRHDVATWKSLRRLASTTDVLHAHGARAGALSVLASATLNRSQRPRVIVTLHNTPVGGRAVRSTATLLEWIVAGGADVILTVSSDLKSRAVRRTRWRRVVAALRSGGVPVIERAVIPAPTRRSAMPPTRSAVMQQHAVSRFLLGWPAGQPVVVTVARLAPQKGLSTLLDAAEMLTTPGVRWIVAGEGPLRESLEYEIGARGLGGRVELWGRRSDVASLLAGADVVVSTAVWEGQPIAMMEALQAGAAIVSTDAGGTRDIVGESSVMVPVGDAAAVAHHVDRLLGDPHAWAELRASAMSTSTQLPTAGDLLAQLQAAYWRV